MVSVPKPHTNTALGLSGELHLALESIFPGMTSNQQNLITTIGREIKGSSKKSVKCKIFYIKF